MKVTYRFYPGGKTKALTMSYDDGQIHDRRLVEIFNRYGIKGTFHLNAGTLDKEPFINASEVRDLYRGHEVASHSKSHPFLSLVPREQLIEEIMEDRKRLEALAGYPVRGFSYPFGDYNESLMMQLTTLGIDYARTVQSHGDFRPPANFMTWHPTCHHNHGLMDLLERFKVNSPWNRMPLFYVWGHSYEFNRDNNWDLMEEFCKRASHDDSVWYATNIELYDYFQGLRSLRFSVDRKMIFNPSGISVWVDVDGQAVEIKPLETLSIGG